MAKRGSLPGERRGGRAKGVPNKATRELKAIAGQYTQEAVETLAGLMRRAESERARVAACKEILDRGHGKAQQSLDVNLPHAVPLFTLPAGVTVSTT